MLSSLFSRPKITNSYVNGGHFFGHLVACISSASLKGEGGGQWQKI